MSEVSKNCDRNHGYSPGLGCIIAPMSLRHALMLGTVMCFSATCLMATASDMAIDENCGGTTLVGGTTFGFMASSSGSGACPTNTNLVFGNVSSNDWFNLLITAVTPT